MKSNIYAQPFGEFAIVADRFGELSQLLAPRDWHCHLFEPAQYDPQPFLQILTQAHGVAAGDDVFQPLAVNRLEYDGGGRCAIAALFIELPEHLAQQHGAHIFIGIGQVCDAPRDQTALSSSSGGLSSIT